MPLFLFAITTLVSKLLFSFNWSAQRSRTGYSAVSAGDTKKGTNSVGTAAANAAVGGGNVAFSFIQSVAASSSVSIDLASLTNVLEESGVVLARCKGLLVEVLSTADDATVVTNNITGRVQIDGSVANGFRGTSNSGWFANATSAIDLYSGDAAGWRTRTAGGVVVDGTHSILKLTNTDATYAAKVRVSGQGGTS